MNNISNYNNFYHNLKHNYYEWFFNTFSITSYEASANLASLHIDYIKKGYAITNDAVKRACEQCNIDFNHVAIQTYIGNKEGV